MSDSPWQPDEYSQPAADYDGASSKAHPVYRDGRVPGKRGPRGKPSKEAKAAQMRRYRARHLSKMREYQRVYQAARRARIRTEKVAGFEEAD